MYSYQEVFYSTEEILNTYEHTPLGRTWDEIEHGPCHPWAIGHRVAPGEAHRELEEVLGGTP